MEHYGFHFIIYLQLTPPASVATDGFNSIQFKRASSSSVLRDTFVLNFLSKMRETAFRSFY